MFGDLMGMMGKMKEARAKMEETKERLNSVYVKAESPDGMLKITLSANKEVKDIEVADELMEDKNHLIDLMVITMNQAIEKAKKVQEAELGAIAKDSMPNIPGLDNLMP